VSGFATTGAVHSPGRAARGQYHHAERRHVSPPRLPPVAPWVPAASACYRPRRHTVLLPV